MLAIAVGDKEPRDATPPKLGYQVRDDPFLVPRKLPGNTSRRRKIGNIEAMDVLRCKPQTGISLERFPAPDLDNGEFLFRGTVTSASVADDHHTDRYAHFPAGKNGIACSQQRVIVVR